MADRSDASVRASRADDLLVRYRRPAAFALWGLMIGAVATAVAAALVAGGGSALGTQSVSFLLPMIGLVFGTVGLLLALRLPANRMGWVFLAGGDLVTIYMAGYSYWFWGVMREWPLVWVAGWVNQAVYFPAILSLIAVPLLLFPTGRVPSPVWRWVSRSVALFGLLSIVVGTTAPAFTDDLNGRDPSQIASQFVTVADGHVSVIVDNPLGVAWLPRTGPLLAAVFVLLVGISFLGPPIAMVSRFRSSTGTVRQQIKWLAFSGSIAAFGLGTFYLIEEVSTPGPLQDVLVTVGLLGVLGIPITAGIAITRYRLYEIDRLISRTISYTLIVILLGLIYAAGAVWLPTRIVGEQSPLFVAGSTLAVAGLFNPIRRSILRQVDRRFHRDQHDARMIAQAFRARLTARVDLEEITGDFADVADRIVQPATIGVWIRPRKGGSPEPPGPDHRPDHSSDRDDEGLPVAAGRGERKQAASADS